MGILIIICILHVTGAMDRGEGVSPMDDMIDHANECTDLFAMFPVKATASTVNKEASTSTVSITAPTPTMTEFPTASTTTAKGKPSTTKSFAKNFKQQFKLMKEKQLQQKSVSQQESVSEDTAVVAPRGTACSINDINSIGEDCNKPVYEPIETVLPINETDGAIINATDNTKGNGYSFCSTPIPIMPALKCYHTLHNK